MRVFGCAWKINFPEVIWSWPCKMRLWTRKWFEAQIFTSNHFRVRRAERERERKRARAREEAQITPSTSPANPELQSDNRTAHYADCSTAPIALRRSISPSILPSRDVAFDPLILDPLISLCDFDFCCCCGGVVVVFWWLWLLIAGVCCLWLNWSFGGVWCWDLAVILKFFVIKFVWMLRK